MSNVIGRRIEKYDGWGHVTGETRFVDDVQIPGTLHVKVLRSPIDKGIIKNLDVSPAARVKGVATVMTGRDIPCNACGGRHRRPVLAEDRVRYRGEPIVAVAAVDTDTAWEAVEQIKLELEEETAVFDPLEAIKPESPQVAPQGNVYQYGDEPFRPIVFGDVQAGFAAADQVVEGEYLHSPVTHAQLEPQASLAVPEASGRLTVYTMSQSLYHHLEQLCRILELPMSKVRYVGGTVGGGFGGKSDMQVDHVAALLALRTGRPVKWRWTRQEETLYSTFRGAWLVRIRDGVNKNGRILARQVTSIRDSGAYTLINAYVVVKHCMMAAGAYYIPNVDVKGYCVLTNKPPAGPMRGFATIAANFATEVQMDRIAEALGIDPWEIRFVNAYRRGEPAPTRNPLRDPALIEVMQTLARESGVELPERLMAMTSADREELT